MLYGCIPYTPKQNRNRKGRRRRRRRMRTRQRTRRSELCAAGRITPPPNLRPRPRLVTNNFWHTTISYEGKHHPARERGRRHILHQPLGLRVKSLAISALLLLRHQHRQHVCNRNCNTHLVPSTRQLLTQTATPKRLRTCSNLSMTGR